MKRIVLAIIATSMLLTNVAFASTKTTHANTSKNGTVSNVKQNSIYHLNTQDPY
jgi:Ni/Co efflux regulator RcnB